MNIFELTQEWLEIVAEIEENGGEVDEEIMLLLEKVEGDLTNKLNSLRYVVRQYEAKAEANAKEAARLTKIATTSENAATRLKESIKQVVLKLGTPETNKKTGKVTHKVESPYGNFSVYENQQLDVTDTPEELLTDTTLIEEGLVTVEVKLEVDVETYEEDYEHLEQVKATVKLDKKALLAALKEGSIKPNSLYKIKDNNFTLKM